MESESLVWSSGIRESQGKTSKIPEFALDWTAPCGGKSFIVKILPKLHFLICDYFPSRITAVAKRAGNTRRFFSIILKVPSLWNHSLWMCALLTHWICFPPTLQSKFPQVLSLPYPITERREASVTSLIIQFELIHSSH